MLSQIFITQVGGFYGLLFQVGALLLLLIVQCYKVGARYVMGKHVAPDSIAQAQDQNGHAQA